MARDAMSGIDGGEGDLVRSVRRASLAVLLGGVVLLVVGIYGTAILGRVEGLEFSPQTWERRSFQYFELPVLGTQARPVERAVSRDPLCAFLVGNGLLTTQQPARWDLVIGWRGEETVDPGTASVLCQYLDATDHRGQLVWLRWTQDHMPQARHFWPEVARLARLGWYELIPDLMRTAQDATARAETADQFRQSIRDCLVRQAATLAAQLAARREVMAARDLFALALEYDPASPAARQGLDSLDSLAVEER